MEAPQKPKIEQYILYSSSGCISDGKLSTDGTFLNRGLGPFSRKLISQFLSGSLWDTFRKQINCS
jgi:hypothetical protein